MSTTLTQEETKAYLHLYYYGRGPSWALAVAATFLFACVTLVHFTKLCFKRTWFIIPLLTGALRTSHFPVHSLIRQKLIRDWFLFFPSHVQRLSWFNLHVLTFPSKPVELLGYAFRAHGLRENFPREITYVRYSTLIVIAPALIAATLYQLLASLIIVNGTGGLSPWILRLSFGAGFGVLDVISYTLQAVGKSTLYYHPGFMRLRLLSDREDFTFASLVTVRFGLAQFSLSLPR